jgi:hypothetical protein
MITYAGQPLLLEDPQRDLSTWLERSLPLADLRIFGPDGPALADSRLGARSSARAKVGLPRANWSVLPSQMKLNTLWWPTGASRFALGLFLAGDDTLTKIKEELDTDGKAELVLKEVEDEGQSITFKKMYLLPPRPLTTPSDDKQPRLFILPIVDQRYFWQFQDAGDFSPECGYGGDTWEDLLLSLGGSLAGQFSVDAPGEGFQNPDQVELTRRYESAPALLDALAWCVGQRIVAYPSGSIHSQSASYAKDRVIYNLNSSSPYHRSVLSGGLSGKKDPGEEPWYEQPRRPEKVRVVFPKYLGGAPQPDGDVYKIDVEGSDYISDTSTLVTDRIKTFYDTAMAEFDEGGSTPDNVSVLTTLAKAIAESYYAWLEVETYDLSFPGLKYWVQNGFDDFTWWHWGHLQPADERTAENRSPHGGAPYGAYTRVASLPVDWGFSQLLHQIGCPSDGSDLAIIKFEVTAAGPYLGDVTPECDYVTAEVLNVTCAGSGVSIGDEVRVWDPERCHFNIPVEILVGSVGWATRMTSPDPYSAFECLEQAEQDAGCRWEVQTLCCTEQIYGG